MRKQYYFRTSSRGLLAWDVDRLVQLSTTLPRKQAELSQLRELDEVWPDNGDRPTWRAIVEHIKLIDEADLSFPIILSSKTGPSWTAGIGWPRLYERVARRSQRCSLSTTLTRITWGSQPRTYPTEGGCRSADEGR